MLRISIRPLTKQFCCHFCCCAGNARRTRRRGAKRIAPPMRCRLGQNPGQTPVKRSRSCTATPCAPSWWPWWCPTQSTSCPGPGRGGGFMVWGLGFIVLLIGASRSSSKPAGRGSFAVVVVAVVMPVVAQPPSWAGPSLDPLFEFEPLAPIQQPLAAASLLSCIESPSLALHLPPPQKINTQLPKPKGSRATWPRCAGSPPSWRLCRGAWTTRVGARAEGEGHGGGGRWGRPGVAAGWEGSERFESGRLGPRRLPGPLGFQLGCRCRCAHRPSG